MITSKKAKNEGIFILKYHDLCIMMCEKKIFQSKKWLAAKSFISFFNGLNF